MQAIILKCKPQSRFHLGETTEVRSNTLTDTSTYIHSDVLFSAFMSQMSLIYPEKTETFSAYFQDEKIKISSAFYCLEHTATKQTIFFLPKPISLNLRQKEGIDHKKLKKIQFLSWKIWQEQILPNQWLDTQLCYLIDDRFVVHHSEIENKDLIKNLSIYKKDDAIKICEHTTEEEGNLYSQADLFLLGNEYYSVHWYFLCHTDLSQDDQKLFDEVWNKLTLAGIGGERSTGAGQIEGLEKIQNLPDFFSQESKQQMTLSLLFPKENELPQLLLYQTKLRGGMFLADNYRLKVIQAILEGAVHTGTKGKIEALHHKESDGIRLRYGKAFSIALPEKYQFKHD